VWGLRYWRGRNAGRKRRDMVKPGKYKCHDGKIRTLIKWTPAAVVFKEGGQTIGWLNAVKEPTSPGKELFEDAEEVE
jgi:hypothetical protein